MSTLKVNNIKDTSGGTSNLKIDGAAKAWVNFNGRNTPSIRDSFNVSSITDLGTGNYRVTFTNAMASANYAIAGSAAELGGGGNNDAFFGAGRDTNYSDLHTTTSCTVTVCGAGGSNSDRDMISAIVFGD
jgi:hypothetical protein|tara:strand:+ start:9590 stop:9979 length:390 start_codon:yes stop_codon:yes gene_type:complete